MRVGMFAGMIVFVSAIADYYLSHRVEHYVGLAEERLERGMCTREEPCVFGGLETDECNALTGGVWTPMVLTERERREARVVFRAPNGCTRGVSNSVEAVAR